MFRDYKFSVKDSLLKVTDSTQTSKRLRGIIGARGEAKGLRVIDYAKGPLYMTKTVREQKVAEITKRYKG